MRMTPFTWTALCTSVLMAFAFPALTVACGLLALDRLLGMHFFTNELGGNMMNYPNLFWIWGHPEVYILILPAFGVFSEVVSTFSRKRLFGYESLVYATAAIAILSFTVWLHHFFTMGSSANVNAFFGITTMIIAVPTGVKVFNWLLTMYRGRITFHPSMLWTVGFIVTFVIGGMTGVLLAMPPADFLMHNTTFLVAHFHNMIIPGVLFGYLAGYMYWFPKAFGFKMNEPWGTAAFWFWIVGFYLAFMPLYVLGLMGMPRRMEQYNDPTWQPWLIAASMGAVLDPDRHRLPHHAARRQRSATGQGNVDVTGDPYDGRTLEWATSSPPPPYNFAVLPEVRDREPLLDMKERGVAYAPPRAYEDIEMPKNSAVGVVMGGLAFVLGFAMVWRIWWLVILCGLAMWATMILRASDDESDYVLTADEVERMEKARYRALEAAKAAGHERQRHGRARPPHSEAAAVHEQRELGFWLYLMGDAVIFALLFMTYGIMVGNTAGGPTGKQLFSLNNAAIETALLLVSSTTFGFASLSSRQGNRSAVLALAAITFLLGAGFVFLEIREFLGMIRAGAGPDRSGFLSAFFTLVGTHGTHVSVGLIWILILSARSRSRGSAVGDLAPVPARPVLALPRHRLGRHLLRRLPSGAAVMERHGLASYLIGFVLAVILTAIPFWLVYTHALPPSRIMLVIAIAAVLQILVHLHFFLHINFTTTPKENLLAIAFTAVLIFLHGGRQPLDHDRPAPRGWRSKSREEDAAVVGAHADHDVLPSKTVAAMFRYFTALLMR